MGSGCLKPAIDVALVGPNGQQSPKQRALVDSGCDFSTFPQQWTALLGIDFDSDCVEIDGNTASGKDKSQRIYRPGIHGLVMGHKVPLAAIFNPQIPIALLGREDFMAYFKVSFDQRRRIFTLDPY
jgi:hypothetical protein